MTSSLKNAGSSHSLDRDPNGQSALALVTVLLLVPILASFVEIGDRAMFNFLASDSMYYMGVANNFVKFGIPTFDGERLVNGFHPLWALLLMGMFKAFAIPHHYQLYAVFVLGLLLVYVAYVLQSCALLSLLGKRSGIIATILLFPGVYSLSCERIWYVKRDPGVLYSVTPYSAANGMEPSIYLALWGYFILTFIKQFRLLAMEGNEVSDLRLFFPLSIRLCMVAIVMARLDDIFLVAAMINFHHFATWLF